MDAKTDLLEVPSNRFLPRVIVVDGEIGAGKSTILVALAEALRAEGYSVAVAQEPVDKWRAVGILGRFYQDPARYAYEFQTYTFVTRIMAVRECFEKNPNAGIFLLERSILTDRHVFMELQRAIVGEQTMDMYDAWCGLHRLLMPFDLSKATYLYLKPDLKECMARVSSRARTEETTKTANASGKGGVSIEYQEKLREAHEVLFEGRASKDIPAPATRPFPLSSVVVVSRDAANGDFSETGKDRMSIANGIVERLGL